MIKQGFSKQTRLERFGNSSNKCQRRKYESLGEQYITQADVEDFFDSILILAKQVVQDYGDKVASYIHCTGGFGFVGSGSTSAKERYPRDCYSLATEYRTEDFCMPLVDEWNKRIAEHISYLENEYTDWEDVCADGEDEFGLSLWFRFDDAVHPLNEMTFEYVLVVNFYDFGGVDSVELCHNEGEDVRFINSLEDSDLDEIACGVKDYLASKDESRSKRMRRKAR